MNARAHGEAVEFAFSNIVQSCLICKIPGRMALCGHCLASLVRMQAPVVRSEDGFLVRSLLSWQMDGPPGISWLVRALKGHERAADWRQLSTLLLQAFGPLRTAVIVPVPSRHSLGLARALGEWTGIPVVEALQSTGKQAQKRKTRRQRQSIQFSRRVGVDCTKFTDVVICDDVVTTGATVRAAFRALGRPPHAEVWCLADRRPCGG